MEYRVPEISKHRANIRMILQCSNATPIRCHGGIGYACCFCAEQYPDPADLKTHNLEYHDDKSKMKFMKDKCLSSFIVKLDITALSCSICYTKIDSLDDLTNHLVKEHGKIIYSDVKNHIVPFKFNDKTLRCVVCSNVFNKFKALLEHMNTHYRNYICEVCDAGYVTRCMLANHGEAHKTGQFKCRHCDKVYDTLRKRRSHEKCVHIYMNMLNKCGYCNEKFKDYRIKEKHIVQVHGIASIELKCQACEKTFPSQRALNTHTKRDHLLERRHKCQHCDMKFYNGNELKNHIVKHTGVKLFQCNVCLKSYGRKKTLAEHMRIHADDRRFKCEHCGQSFVQKCSWRGHMRSKHGEVV
jgi:hypothetical protein